MKATIKQEALTGISGTRIRLMYRAIFVALIGSILTTPIALLVSYKITKARYDRIVERQVGEFSQRLFSKITPGTGRDLIEEVIAEYLLEKEVNPSPDAILVFASLTDEFSQIVAEKGIKSQSEQIFSKAKISECINNLVPIMAIGDNSYFCSISPIVRGYVHYTLYGVLRVSERVVMDFVNNTLSICGFSTLIVVMISVFQYYVSLRVSKTLMKANVKTLLLLGNTIALRDNDTFHHNLRVMIYSYFFGLVVHLTEDTMNELISGALLHDIGKIGIPDGVLQKPGRLNAEEFEIIKGHVALGEQIMTNSEWVNGGVDVIKFHHERYDGAGYPHKTCGSEIPLIARMFAIVDVFDAITSRRPYKEPRSYEDTMSYIISSKGGHFDPELVDKFIEVSRMLYENYANRDDDTIVAEANRILNIYYG